MEKTDLIKFRKKYSEVSLKIKDEIIDYFNNKNVNSLESLKEVLELKKIPLEEYPIFWELNKLTYNYSTFEDALNEYLVKSAKTYYLMFATLRILKNRKLIDFEYNQGYAYEHYEDIFNKLSKELPFIYEKSPYNTIKLSESLIYDICADLDEISNDKKIKSIKESTQNSDGTTKNRENKRIKELTAINNLLEKLKEINPSSESYYNKGISENIEYFKEFISGVYSKN
ncbi:hypothetical protein [Methanococcus voltae]|uniref:Uncharacterized protein n=1 Tax=Methanococcus voltae (strain ATCC BAA-1334 / A3) TaxID=456320 RepID=D7DSU0_METV3|nr:hypothetical protein [Methanococcus voltae]MCS3901801.1 hypothetical protein [Methanococcus voltae]